MKKIGILNQPISALIAGLGHTDTIVIADAGLPIPANVQRIDLALEPGAPSFLDTLRVVLSELHVESVTVAVEMEDASPTLFNAMQDLLGATTVALVPHEEFKRQTEFARAVIRTGEFSPYANVILHAGVIF